VTPRKSTTRTDPQAALRGARESAERKLESAQSTCEATRHRAEALRASLRQGDESVTTEMLALVDVESERASLLAASAAEGLDRAVAAERLALATAVAESLPGRLERGISGASRVPALEAMTENIRAIVASTDERNGHVRDAIDSAREVGLVDGKCDPLSPVIAGRDYQTGTSIRVDYIVVNGTRFTELDRIEHVVSIAQLAFDAAGIPVTVAGAVAS